MPEDFLLPVSVTVAGWPWGSSDRETVRQYERGLLRLRPRGVWYEDADESGLRKLYLYPTPSGGDTLELEWVYRPAPLSVDEPAGEPDELPEEFHPALLSFVAKVYFETVEDNPQLAAVHGEKADLAVSELVRYDNMRGSGNGIFVVPIAGVSA